MDSNQIKSNARALILATSMALMATACGRSGFAPSGTNDGFVVSEDVRNPQNPSPSEDIPTPDEPSAPQAKEQSPSRPDADFKYETFPALTLGEAGSDYLRYFSRQGQPNYNYDSRLKKKFKSRFNHRAENVSAENQKKWRKIFFELQRATNREVPSSRSLLMIGESEAKHWSEELERSGASPLVGAWSIAVKQTAVRHGFPKTPCAEFVSEMLREAYKRAGYRIEEDFNIRHGNQLIWSNSASVAGLAQNLVTAGWIPWNTHDFKAPVGAIMMHETGQTPGHVYFAAGSDGRFIVDNGAPQGRDLGTTKDRTIGIMFKSGVFFLPPGAQPEPWLNSASQN